MKHFFTFLAAVLLTATSVAQVGINIETADASAALDISSITAGLLMPRMSNVQRDAITSPATGLMIYQTDGEPGIYNYNGGSWAKINQSTDKRVKIPIYTQSQVDALTPQLGDIVYNYSSQTINFYANTSGSVTTTSRLQSDNGYYSCRYCGDTYDYLYNGTTTEDIWIMDLGVNSYDMSGNEFTWIIYKDDDLDINNGLGDVVSYGELIPSGSKIHIGVKGGTNNQWKHVYDSSNKPSFSFISLEDNSAYHNIVISLKTASLGWKTIITF